MAGTIGIKGRKAVVVGANASGIALVKFLVRRGATVTLVDERAAELLNEKLEASLDLSKFALEAGPYQQKTFETAQLIVVTPGVPLDHKFLEVARTAGVQVLSELEFVSLFIDEPIIAISGTNGKTTTAALLTRMLEADGKTVFSTSEAPYAEYLNKNKTADFIVAETDSFQLEGLVNFKPKMVLFLNLSEDHLDRYPNFETYLAANREVLRNADATTEVVLSAADPHVMGFAQGLPGRTLFFGPSETSAEFDGAWYTKDQLLIRMKGKAEPFGIALKNFRLRGGHNRENLAAAALAALRLGAKPSAIEKVVETFAALPGRVEFVRRLNSIAFYNDSYGTNVNAVVRTLQAFYEPVILIAGGRDKNADYSPLIPHIRQRVKNLILIGEAKEKVNRALGDFTETFLVGTLEEAILIAYQKSRGGDVILLSPGCDCTDAFSSHEERGESFKKLVNAISQPRRPNVI